MNTSKDIFKKYFVDAFTKDPKIKIDSKTMNAANQYIGNLKEDSIEGGIADKKTFNDLIDRYKQKGKNIGQIEKELKLQLNKGIKVEMEHTKDRKVAKEIAMDHLFEDPKYYDKLKKIENKEAATASNAGPYSTKLFSGQETKKIETKEATTSASVGAYETPAAWAKSTRKKDFGGARKPQIPGGSFVSIKKKCKKFPYCNQGDINALNLYEKKNVKEAISNLSKKMKISENTIKAIIQHELENMSKRKK
jgi:hypothetical protein